MDPSAPHELTGSLVPTWTPWIPLDLGWLTKVFPERGSWGQRQMFKNLFWYPIFHQWNGYAGILECSGAPLLWSIASVSSSTEAWALLLSNGVPKVCCVERPQSLQRLLCGEGLIAQEICTTAMVSRLGYGAEDSPVTLEYIILRSHQVSAGHHELTSSSPLPWWHYPQMLPQATSTMEHYHGVPLKGTSSKMKTRKIVLIGIMLIIWVGYCYVFQQNQYFLLCQSSW